MTWPALDEVQQSCLSLVELRNQHKAMTYMQELDRWTDTTVLAPLFDAVDAGKGIEEALENARKVIRIKVLESYRNGAKRCPNCHGSESKPTERPFRRPYRPRRD